MKRVVAVSAVTVVLAACGGGGGSSDNAPSAPEANAAQGLYSGTDANGNVVGGVVLETGAFYFVYANTTTNALGLVQGAASASHGTFQSDNARTFDISGKAATDTPVLAGYNAKNSVQGVIYTSTAKQNSIKFNVVYDANYERPVALSSVAGTYSGAAGSTKDGETATFVIGQDGSIKGEGLSGCTFSGTATPHGDKDVLDATIAFGPAPCIYPGAKLTGVVFFSGSQVLGALTLPDRSDAFVVAATK
ncbi:MULTISPECIES: hypothetical protein [Caballeronia]|jgi:hypothetical protein|uniref:Lipoprotein n=1 Tax=Caballeronia zhejiangensis TaxID=871203 RepID=A0A656QD22_9BURK|nr:MULTISPECIES: hypothetical protein [Caballeronia]KDR25231.1 hypothetical protein BG60_30495 [Caballeronia zhejiangensis]MDR5790610.1 hypothetical protein [Caballeronia sp. LP003]